MTTGSGEAGPGAVASPHAEATRAGLRTLADGGNAVDAALGVAAMLIVVYPHQCSIGGDAIAMVGTADGEVRVVNGSGRSAAVLDPADYDEHGHVPVRGARSVTVPGVLSTWFELAHRWGRRGLADALGPAAAAAADGFAVTPGLHRELVREEELLRRDAGARAAYLPSGQVPAVGSTLRLPRLAATLATLAVDGTDAFYAGATGRSVLATLRGLGGDLTERDLAEHRVQVEVPAAATFAGSQYLSATGNSQGGFFLQGLAALELAGEELGRRVDPLGPDAAVVARILAGAAANRDERLGDGADEDSLLDADVVRALADRGLTGAVTRPGPSRRRPPTRAGDTVAIVAADADGTWVSLIQSVFHAFGSGIVDPGTGILLHDRGAAFTLDPRRPSCLRPGARPPHTLMPVLVRAGGSWVGAHGTMGGRAQPQIHTHLAANLALGHPPAGAVERARWVIGQLEAGPVSVHDAVTVEVEADVPAVASEALRDAAFTVRPLDARDDAVGHAQLVRRTATDLVAATDPRADG